MGGGRKERKTNQGEEKEDKGEGGALDRGKERKGGVRVEKKLEEKEGRAVKQKSTEKSACQRWGPVVSRRARKRGGWMVEEGGKIVMHRGVILARLGGKLRGPGGEHGRKLARSKVVGEIF